MNAAIHPWRRCSTQTDVSATITLGLGDGGSAPGRVHGRPRPPGAWPFTLQQGPQGFLEQRAAYQISAQLCGPGQQRVIESHGGAQG